MNDIKFKSTFDEIEFNIAMKMYWEHNDKIASINEHLGEMYSYKDLEEAKALEEYDTLQEYRKALKEKCDAIDKAIEYITNGSDFKSIYFKKTDEELWKILLEDNIKNDLLEILRGDYNEKE